MCFALAGAGAGFQHSLSSALLVRAFGSGARRRALGTYNASGDAGKLAFTALFGVAVGAGMAWNVVVGVLAVVAMLSGVGVWFALQRTGGPATSAGPVEAPVVHGWGVRARNPFTALVTMILLVGMVQELFLTFVAFMALSKGLGASAAAAAVTVTLAGGMVGKFACGHLAARLGDRTTFVLLQVLAGFGIVAVVLVPGAMLLALLPFVGLVVQGSSTVTYGSVADHALEGRQARVYSLVYTVSNGSSLVGPLMFGLIADAYGLNVAFMMLAALTCLTLPLSLVLSGKSLPVVTSASAPVIR